MVNKFFLFPLLCLVTFSACKKGEKLKEENVNKKEIILPQTQEEIKTVAEINEFSKILKQLCMKPEVNREIAALVLSGYYQDERIKVKDLLHPAESDAYKNIDMRKMKFVPGSFKEAYFKLLPNEVPKRIATIDESDLTIYYPYSEVTNEAIAADEPVTYVSAEYYADEGPGYLLDNSANEVLVNDEYAYDQPTFILTDGAVPTEPNDPCLTNPTWCNPPLDPIPNLNIRRVEVGWIRTKGNYDHLIGFNHLNCGGNEITLGRTIGFLRHNTDGQIGEFSALTAFSFSRLDGKNKTWIPVYSVWDPNWKPENLEQVLTVWEKDNKSSQEISGSLTTTMKKTVNGVEVNFTGTVGFKHTVISQEPISHAQNWSWNAYIGTTRNPVQPNGTTLSPTRNNGWLNFVSGIMIHPFVGTVANFSNGTAKDVAYLPNGEAWSVVNLGYLADVTWPYQLVQ